MNIEQIKAEVAHIESIKWDDEVAHSLEDNLHLKFIGFVAQSGPPELAAMALEVLKTKDMDFARWCA